MEEKLGIWLILDLFVRIITMLAVVTILAKSLHGLILTLMVVLFISWAFRPMWLAWKNFQKDMKKKPKQKIKINKKKIQPILNIIFWILFSLGFILFINRAFIPLLPSENWRILLDHLVGGFLVTILFYILLLGMFSFFRPNRKINYKIKWFILASFVTFAGSFYWEGMVQNFRDVGQITADYLGLFFSWIYFLIFRRIQNG